MLAGGGARAAYEVGVLKALFNGSCPAAKGAPAPEVFCGTGAGAFNAAVIASRLPGQFPEPVEYLASLWADEIPREGRMRHNRIYRRRLETKQFFDLPYLWRRPLKAFLQYFGDLGLLVPEYLGRTWNGLAHGNWSGWLNLEILHDTSPMLRLISESVNLGVIRDGEKDGPLPKRFLRVIATEKGSGKPHIFRNADFAEETGHAAILASCSLPVIFPPVTIEAKTYFYGGLVMQAPLQPAVDAGATVIHLIHNEPKQVADGASDASAREMMNHTIAVALSATLERDLDSRRRINAVLDGFAEAKAKTGLDPCDFVPMVKNFQRVVVHQYRPKHVLGGRNGFLNFERDAIEASIRAGYEDTVAHNCAESECIL